MAEGQSTATGQEQTPQGGSSVEGFQSHGGETKVVVPQTQAGGAEEGAGDGKSSEGDESGTGDSGEGENKGDVADADGKYAHPDTGEKITGDELTAYYRDKFSASSAGAQALLAEKQTLTSELGTSKATIESLTKELETLKQVAEGKNPEGLQAHELQESLKKTTEELAVLKEDSLLDRFEKSTPLAANKRDALRTLARANPTKSLQELWDNNLKAGADAEEAKRVADEKKRKEGAGDKGKGTSTREPAGNGDTIKGPKGDSGLTQAEFDKLPVRERGRILAQIGV